MTLPTYYATGSASVNTGATTVTGTGTGWGTDSFGTPVIAAGDFFMDPAQPEIPPQRIASVTDATHLLLARPWPGVNVSGPYEVQFVGDIVRSTAQTRRYLERLGQLAALGIQPNAFGTFADRSTYDDESKGYIFLSLDGDGASDVWTLYIKETATAGDWDAGQAVAGARGDQGEPGLIGVWRGAWVTTTAYAENDAVSQGGSSYIALEAHTSGTFATDLAASKWEVMAQKGVDGANGADGADGAPGEAGTDGLGVPAGGTARQVLKKASNADNDTEWATDITVAAVARTPIWMPGRDYALPVGGGAGTAAIINAAIATIAALGGGELVLPPETMSLDGTIDNNVSNVLVRGLNRTMWNDAGTPTFGTLIVPTFAGTVLKHRTPYNGASQAQHRGGGFAALTVTGNAVATRLLEVDSVRLATYDLYLANSVGAEAVLFKCGVTGTDIGDAADIQRCDIDLRVRQTNAGLADDAHCVVFRGSSNANVSINTGIKLDLMHINGDGLVIESADNNVFELFRAYRPSGTGASSRSKASAGGGLIAVSNVFQFYSSNTSAVLQGTDVAALPASAQIDFLDVANSSPMPTLGTAASCPVLNAVTAYTPNVASRTGAITTVDSIEGRWMQDANKKVTAFVSFRVVTNGTGAGAIDVSLPRPMRSAVVNGNVTGKEVAVTGKLIGGAVDTTNGAAIQYYDGVYPGANGAVFRLKIEYEGY